MTDNNIQFLTETETPNKDMRFEKILNLSDRMLEKISRALDEVDICVIKDKKRVKKVEYDDEMKKPLKETYTEKETVRTEKSTVDTSALKQLVSTLKDIRDIQAAVHYGSESSEEDENGVILISDIADLEEKL